MKKLHAAALCALMVLAYMFFIAGSVRALSDVQKIEFINRLSEKESVTYGEGVAFMVMAIGYEPSTFGYNIQTLKTAGIKDGLDYEESRSLRKGIISAIIADYLDLGDSLFYLIFGTERYAFRACVAEGILDPNASEWDGVSGGELIEIMDKVAERAEGRAKKR